MKKLLLFIPFFVLFSSCSNSNSNSNSTSDSGTDARKSKAVQKNINPASTSEFDARALKALNSGDLGRWQVNEYRNENWKPTEGRYFFSEQWTWEFENKGLAEDELFAKGEMSVYVDPQTGTYLFTNKDSKIADDMTDFVIVASDGRYILGLTGEDGKKTRQDGFYEGIIDAIKATPKIKMELAKNLGKGGVIKEFGTNKYNWPTVKAQEFEIENADGVQKFKFSLAELPMSFYPFYFINKINDDIKVPIEIDFLNLLPHNYFPLNCEYIGKGQGYKYTLKSMSNAEHHLDINSYAK